SFANLSWVSLSPKSRPKTGKRRDWEDGKDDSEGEEVSLLMFHSLRLAPLTIASRPLSALKVSRSGLPAVPWRYQPLPVEVAITRACPLMEGMRTTRPSGLISSVLKGTSLPIWSRSG